MKIKKSKQQMDEERLQGIVDALSGKSKEDGEHDMQTTKGFGADEEDDGHEDEMGSEQDEDSLMHEHLMAEEHGGFDNADDGEDESLESEEGLPEGDVSTQEHALMANDEENEDEAEDHDAHVLTGEEPEVTRKKMKIGLFSKMKPLAHMMKHRRG